MADKRLSSKEIQLKGKLITRDDPALVADNFQSLTNMRYVTGPIPHIKSIAGMSKINTNVIDSTYLKTRSAIHFTKSIPSETHVLAQVYNDGLTASKIYDNTTSIPNTGDFNSTAIYAPDTNGSTGRWSLAPDGDVAYCNGEESCVYGGDQREIAGFINYNPDGSFLYDHTDKVRNTLTDEQNIAVLNSNVAGVDSDTMLLLHLDNDVTDSSPATAHTVTNNNVTFTAAGAPFGGYWAVFNGTNAYLTIPDDADFDFSGGTFTIEAEVNVDNLTANHVLYYQNTTSDADSFKFYIDTNGAICVSIKASSAEQLNSGSEFKSADGTITAGTTYHIELVENGNDWYIFLDGILTDYLSDSARCANYTGNIQIGYDGTDYMTGKIDEYRVSDSARHTANFEAPTNAYSDSTSQVNLYVGAIRPINGFKLAIGTANTSTSSMSVYYHNGSSWTSVSNLTDNTASGGISLAQTGTVTFDSTTASAKIKYINNVVVYWYKVVIDSVSANTSITNVTVSCPFQTIKDTWDGSPREINSFQIYKNNKYNDVTLPVREDIYPYSATDTQDMAELDSLPTSGYIVAGFSEQQTALNIRLVSGHVNTQSGTVCTVSYWTGSEWSALTVEDGTIGDSISFAKSGTISWNAPSVANEYTQSISNDAQLFYYKISFSKSLSGDVQVYYVYGIPAQKKIGAYKFPLHAQGRLFLCCNEKEKKNSVLAGAVDSSAIFNGDDSTTLEFGDDTEITAGAWIYSQFGSTLYNIIVFFKQNETWALVGSDPDTWVKYRISATIGCIAPDTVKVVDITSVKTAEGLGKAVVVWQGANGLYMSDGRTPIPISDDISDVFDKQESTVINTAVSSKAFFDQENHEYHWLYADGSNTTLNREKVFSFKKMGWFDIDRTSNLQAGLEVVTTDGTTYAYGFIDTGYMLRLENGTTFDGQDIISSFQFGDISLAKGSVVEETSAEYHGLFAVAKTTTSNLLTITHYGDSASTGTSWTKSAQKSGYRLLFPVEHKSLGSCIFHSWKFSMTTNDETIGFEPLYFFAMYYVIRDHRRDWR